MKINGSLRIGVIDNDDGSREIDLDFADKTIVMNLKINNFFSNIKLM